MKRQFLQVIAGTTCKDDDLQPAQFTNAIIYRNPNGSPAHMQKQAIHAFDLTIRSGSGDFCCDGCFFCGE